MSSMLGEKKAEDSTEQMPRDDYKENVSPERKVGSISPERKPNTMSGGFPEVSPIDNLSWQDQSKELG